MTRPMNGMTRRQRRQAERTCKAKGHTPKNGAPGERYCARCEEPLPLAKAPPPAPDEHLIGEREK